MKTINLIKHMAGLVIEHDQLQAKARGLGVGAEELNIALASVIDLMAAGLTQEDLQTMAKTVASGRFHRSKAGKHAR